MKKGIKKGVSRSVSRCGPEGTITLTNHYTYSGSQQLKKQNS